MPMSKERREQINKWDSENMAYQTIKVRKSLLDAFKAACAERGDKVNTVLREAMERYVGSVEQNEHGEFDVEHFLRSNIMWNGLVYTVPSRQDEGWKALSYLCDHIDYAKTLTADLRAIKEAHDKSDKQSDKIDIKTIMIDKNVREKIFGEYWKLVDALQDKVIAHMRDEGVI